MKAGKVWGETTQILRTPLVEFHRIHVEPGGYCSKHLHRHKWNGFYVASGTLEVTVFKTDYDLVDTTVLGAGDFMAVAPGEYHQFRARTAVDAFELYWPEALGEDIARETCGGHATG